MGCLSFTFPDADFSLLGGLNIDITLPTLSFDAALCCKIASFTLPAPPVSFGVVPPGISVGIGAALKAVQAFIDSIPPKCPRE